MFGLAYSTPQFNETDAGVMYKQFSDLFVMLKVILFFFLKLIAREVLDTKQKWAWTKLLIKICYKDWLVGLVFSLPENRPAKEWLRRQ